MWKTQVGRAVREVRFVLKQGPEHHGAWRFVFTQLPELIKLNQNTFFTVQPIGESFQSLSGVHMCYGDTSALEEAIESANVSVEEFEQKFKEKVLKGLTLNRKNFNNNLDRDLPIDVVEAHKYVQYQDDAF